MVAGMMAGQAGHCNFDPIPGGINPSPGSAGVGRPGQQLKAGASPTRPARSRLPPMGGRSAWATRAASSKYWPAPRPIAFLACTSSVPMPVSYTHLDVYKRQAAPCEDSVPLCLCGWKGDLSCPSNTTFSLSVVGPVAILPPSEPRNWVSMSVSYTHLDVYKRQAQCSTKGSDRLRAR